MVLILVFMFGINWLSIEYISNPIIYFKYNGMGVKVAEAILRTGIIVIIGLIIIYYTKISKEINDMINKMMGVKSKELGV